MCGSQVAGVGRVSDELRETRVREVMALLEQAWVMGVPVVVGPDGRHVGIMYSAVYGVDDDAAESVALEEAFERGRVGGPVIAELQELAKTEEGRGILLEAYRRWRERD
jgi:hypothetical protein